MKVKFIEISFDDVTSFAYPLYWFERLVNDKRYFRVLGIYEREVKDND